MYKTIPIRLLNAVKSAWDEQTCFPGDLEKWNENLPETGQCAVTALVINDMFGGKIVFNAAFDHFWNILPNGEELDLTKGQFDQLVTGDTVLVSREVLLCSAAARKFKTQHRYLLLKKRVNSWMNRSKCVY